MQIVDAIRFWANATPLHPAIIQPEGVRTYRLLADAIEAAADHFAAAGLDPENPVAVSVNDPARMLVASLGLLQAGFSVVLASQPLLEHLPATGASALVSERGGLIWPDHETIVFDHAWTSTGRIRDRAGSTAAPARRRDGNTIFFTSGSTGRPKMVVQTEAARVQRMLHSKITLFAEFERVLIIPALSSTFGFNNALEILYAGKTLCFANLGEPALYLANVYAIDMIFASPQQAFALAEVQEKITRFRLPALKGVRIGGGLISRQGMEKLKLNLCRNIIMAYGVTEAGSIARAPYDMIADIPGAVGFVLPEVRVEIVDVADNALRNGKEGFVRLQTPSFDALRDGRDRATGDPKAGWFYPGDIGWLTENGVLCIAGRREDVLNRGGLKLAARDFEEFLIACPGVRDAGVCSMIEAADFTEIWVGVVLDPTIDMGTFRRHIESDVQFGGNIDKLFVVEEIPRGEMGKIKRHELQELLKSIGHEI
jgi:acyl-coenzyme A synthetase/AMP-(fatty) acid ligase